LAEDPVGDSRDRIEHHFQLGRASVAMKVVDSRRRALDQLGAFIGTLLPAMSSA